MVRAVVADLSHYTWEKGFTPDFKKAAAAGCVGVIYKASQGTTYRDPTYQKSRAAAQAAGLLWGAYHFGTAADVKAQLANFLAAAKPDADTLVCLDFEKNEQSPANSIAKGPALEFLSRLEQAIGRRPTLYTGSYMYDLFGKAPVRELSTYRVWWARYSAQAEVHPTWNAYWLWQYTDGQNGPKPREISGFGYCDCNTFDGSDADLRKAWAGG